MNQEKSSQDLSKRLSTKYRGRKIERARLKARCEMYRRNGTEGSTFYYFCCARLFLEPSRKRERERESEQGHRRCKARGREATGRSPMDVRGLRTRGRQELPVPRSNMRSRRCHVWETCTQTRAEGERRTCVARTRECTHTRDGAQWETFTCRISSPRI